MIKGVYYIVRLGEDACAQVKDVFEEIKNGSQVVAVLCDDGSTRVWARGDGYTKHVSPSQRDMYLVSAYHRA